MSIKKLSRRALVASPGFLKVLSSRKRTHKTQRSPRFSFVRETVPHYESGIRYRPPKRCPIGSSPIRTKKHCDYAKPFPRRDGACPHRPQLWRSSLKHQELLILNPQNFFQNRRLRSRNFFEPTPESTPSWTQHSDSGGKNNLQIGPNRGMIHIPTFKLTLERHDVFSIALS